MLSVHFHFHHLSAGYGKRRWGYVRIELPSVSTYNFFASHRIGAYFNFHWRTSILHGIGSSRTTYGDGTMIYYRHILSTIGMSRIPGLQTHIAYRIRTITLPIGIRISLGVRIEIPLSLGVGMSHYGIPLNPESTVPLFC